MKFGSHADRVVAVAAALVNVATPGHSRSRTYAVPTGSHLAEVVGRALRSGEAGIADPDPDRLPTYVELAAAVRPVFEMVQAARFDEASAMVNTLLARYQPAPSLERHEGELWHLHFHTRPAVDRSGWGGGISVALATVLGSEYADRLGVCEAPACDRVFVDISRNGTRRFCSTACQNRVKAANHRARHA